MTRRSLIQRLLVVLGIDVGDLLARVSEASVETGKLSGNDREDLVAFAEVLTEGRTLAPAERQHLEEHIADRAARRPDVVAAYRAAVRTLERLAGQRVASLDLGQRVELVARHRLAVKQVRPGEDLGPFAEDVRVLRTRVVPDLIGGYYNSPAGWAIVGYDAFPGRCGDLTRYVRAGS
jgi:hypothetical protein